MVDCIPFPERLALPENLIKQEEQGDPEPVKNTDDAAAKVTWDKETSRNELVKEIIEDNPTGKKVKEDQRSEDKQNNSAEPSVPSLNLFEDEVPERKVAE